MRWGRLALALVLGLQHYRTAADGPRRTIGIGPAGSITCYHSRAGEVVPCR